MTSGMPEHKAGEHKEPVIALTALKVNKKARVVRVCTKERPALRKLLSMGILPKADIVLLHKFPAFVFRKGHSVFSIDRELASLVFVKGL